MKTTSTIRGVCSAFVRVLFAAALLLTPVFAAAQTSSNTITAMAAGGYHSLFIKSDGTLWAMGNNYLGQLGDGTTTSRNTPVQVKIAGKPVTDAIAVAAGDTHSLFVRSDGTLWAMGSNFTGQLGTAITDQYAPTPDPVQVKVNGVAVTKVTAVASAGWTSFFVKSDNTLWAMGDDQTYSSNPVPTPVPDGTDVKSVAAGNDKVLVLKKDGTLWRNAYSYENNYPFSLKQVLDDTGAPVTGVTAVAVGNIYTRYFIKSGGSLWILGGDSGGDTPAQVPGISNVIAVAAGGDYDCDHTLFIKSDNTLWAMGDNNFGQLGNGSTKGSNTPVPVYGGDNVTNVVAGSAHTLFVKSDGTLWAMGRNSSGQLGNGVSTEKVTPVQVSGGANATTASADYNTTLFVKNGALWLMGGDVYDRGIATDRSTPAQVPGATSVKGVSGGSYNLVFKNDGSLWNYTSTWDSGSNVRSLVQVPDVTGVSLVAAGGWNNRLFVKDRTLWFMDDNYSYGGTPQPVPNGDNVIAVAAAGDYGNYDFDYGHRLFAKNDGTLWAMGHNTFGQFGDGTTMDSSTPVQVPGVTDVKIVAAGNDYGSAAHSLFIKNDDTLWAMGSNDYGQLGDGTTTNRSKPVQVKGGTNVKAVAAGVRHSLFVKNDGTLWAMGLNIAGQLGDGTTTNRSTPVQVKINGVAVIDAKAVFAGETHSLFIRNDNTLWAVGLNFDGQLGDASFADQITNVPVRVSLDGSVNPPGPGPDPDPQPSPGGGGGGGGGAPSLLYLVAALALAAMRNLRRRK